MSMMRSLFFSMNEGADVLVPAVPGAIKVPSQRASLLNNPQ